MNLSRGLYKNLIKRYIGKAEFGLEKESLRVSEEGFLSHTEHPFEEQHNITRDFCENQIELITDVFEHAEDVLLHLQQLQAQVVQRLQQMETGKEWLWPFSNPPYVKGSDDIPIAQFSGIQAEKTEYRNYLAGKYGKGKMLFSGIHLNYSFTGEMLREGYQLFLSEEKKNFCKGEIPTFQSYKNHLYLQLTQKLVWHSWLIVYLTAASPVLDASFLNCVAAKEQEAWKEEMLTEYASVRCGELGYWNDFIPVFDYRNLYSYIQSMEAYVQSGNLCMSGLIRNGIRHRKCWHS